MTSVSVWETNLKPKKIIIYLYIWNQKAIFILMFLMPCKNTKNNNLWLSICLTADRIVKSSLKDSQFWWFFFFSKYFSCLRIILDFSWPEFLEFYLYFRGKLWPLCHWWWYRCEPQWIHCLCLRCGDAHLLLKGLHLLPIECALFQNECHGFLNVENNQIMAKQISTVS